jgi:hypothetical protein
LKGLCIGGCISTEHGKDEDGKPWSGKRITNNVVVAHAHNKLDDMWCGWICSPFRLLLTNKWVLLHEVAHLIAVDAGHGKQWKETVELIGGSLKPKAINWCFKMLDYRKVKDKADANSSDIRHS